MSTILSEIRPGAYFDSVVLMQLQRALADLPDVIDAGVVMATPANCDLLAASGLEVDTQAGADDLLIVVKATNEAAAGEALGQVDDLLTRRRGGIAQEFRPRSLEGAIKQLPESQWVLVSVPGRYAADVARDALKADRHVFIFSDNVPVEDEVELKQTAREKGLMVMGPDCGTAIVNGVGLGFANYVRRGVIGLVGASVSGLQAITSDINNLGAGVSQAIGTGGRDLSIEVGGITAIQGLDLLARDDQSEVIVIVSKPPQPEVAVKLLAMARQVRKPVVVDFIGYSPPARRIGNIYFASGLGDAARLAVDLAMGKIEDLETSGSGPAVPGTGSGYLRGLFSGGTLAYEAMLGLQSFLTPIYSNVPITESQRIEDVWASHEHTILDLGDDVFTQGRLHPMMDNDLRLRRLQHEAADPEVSMILLDLILGAGAHMDPAAEIAPAVSEALAGAKKDGRSLEIAFVVIGTSDDPQDLSYQMEQLQQAGAILFSDPARAVEYVSRRFARPSQQVGQPVSLDTFRAPLVGINVGLEIFHDSLQDQGAHSIQVEWRPPAGGNESLMALLAKMK